MCFNNTFSSSECPLTPASQAFSNILDNNVPILTAAPQLVATSNTKSKSVERVYNITSFLYIIKYYKIFQFIHWKDIKTIQNSQMVFLGGYSRSLTLTLWQCYHLTHYTQLPISSNYLPILNYFEDIVMYKPKIKLLM